MKEKSKARGKKTVSQFAVESTPDVASAYQRGLRALRRNEAGLITAANPRLIDGSVDIDKAVETLYPDTNRWDYVIGYANKVCFVFALFSFPKNPKQTPKKIKRSKHYVIRKLQNLLRRQ